MVDLSTKKPPYSREELESSVMEYILGEASNEHTESTEEAHTQETKKN